jgi:ketosteroid isomerase-like protein
MSNDAIVVALRAAFSGYEANDRGALLKLLADDFVFEMSDSVRYGGTYVGVDEFQGFWREVARDWLYFRYDLHDVVDGGNAIAVPVKTDALSVNGIRMQNEHLFLFKVKDGRLVHCRLYADTARGRDVLASIRGEAAFVNPT